MLPGLGNPACPTWPYRPRGPHQTARRPRPASCCFGRCHAHRQPARGPAPGPACDRRRESARPGPAGSRPTRPRRLRGGERRPIRFAERHRAQRRPLSPRRRDLAVRRRVRPQGPRLRARSSGAAEPGHGRGDRERPAGVDHGAARRVRASRGVASRLRDQRPRPRRPRGRRTHGRGRSRLGGSASSCDGLPVRPRSHRRDAAAAPEAATLRGGAAPGGGAQARDAAQSASRHPRTQRFQQPRPRRRDAALRGPRRIAASCATTGVE